MSEPHEQRLMQPHIALGCLWACIAHPINCAIWKIRGVNPWLLNKISWNAAGHWALVPIWIFLKKPFSLFLFLLSCIFSPCFQFRSCRSGKRRIGFYFCFIHCFTLLPLVTPLLTVHLRLGISVSYPVSWNRSTLPSPRIWGLIYFPRNCETP